MDKHWQQKFRRACIKGDIRAVQHVVCNVAASQDTTIQGALTQLMSICYDDDIGGSGLMYLAAGCEMSSKRLQTHAAAATGTATADAGSRLSCQQRRPSSRQCACACISSSDSSNCNAPSSSRDSSGDHYLTGFAVAASGAASAASSKRPVHTADAGRTAVLQWLFDEAKDCPLDLSLVNGRCQNVLHCCLLNGGSPNVLQLLLAIPSSYMAHLTPDMSLCDEAGMTPFNLAIALQDWHCVALMVAAGAAAHPAVRSNSSGSSRTYSNSSNADMAAALKHVRALAPEAAEGGSSSVKSLSSAVAGNAGLAFKSIVGGLMSRLPQGWANVLGAATGMLPVGLPKLHTNLFKQQRQQLLDTVSANCDMPNVALAAGASDGIANSSHAMPADAGLSDIGCGAHQSWPCGCHSSNFSATPVRACSVAGIIREVQLVVQQIAETVPVPEATAMGLLMAHGFCRKQAIAAATVCRQGTSSSNSSTSSYGSASNVGPHHHQQQQQHGKLSTSHSCWQTGSTATTQQQVHSSNSRLQQCMVCFETVQYCSSSTMSNHTAFPDTVSNAAPSSGLYAYLQRLRERFAGSISCINNSKHQGAATAATTAAAGPVAASVQLPCGHTTCDSCWRGILQACIEELGPQKASCPEAGCYNHVTLEDVQRLLASQMYTRYLDLLARHIVDSSPHRRWCPAAGCSRSLYLQLGPEQQDCNHTVAMWQSVQSGRGLDVVCDCGHRFCFVCGEAAHEPASCQQAASWRRLVQDVCTAAETESALWLLDNTNPCPRCGSRIQKQGGCNHMSCKVCNKQFCWVCGRDWNEHSQATGGYYFCTLQPDAAAMTANNASMAIAANGQFVDGATGSLLAQAALGSETSGGLLGSIVNAFKTAILSQKEQRYMRLHASQTVDVQKLQVLARYMQLLLDCVLQQAEQSCSQQHSNHHLEQQQRCIGLGHLQKQHQQQLGLKALLAHNSSIEDLLLTTAAVQPGMAVKQQQQQVFSLQQRLQQQGFEPLSAALLRQWLDCVVDCKRTLQSCCILGLYLESSTAKTCLDAVQGNLAHTVDQLIAVLQQVPAAQQVLDAAAAAASAQRRSSSMLHTAKQWWAYSKQALQYYTDNSNRSASGQSACSVTIDTAVMPTPAAAVPKTMWFDVPITQLQQQVHYVLAVSYYSKGLQQSVLEARELQAQLVQSARLGCFEQFDLPAAAAAAQPVGSAAAAGGGSTTVGCQHAQWPSSHTARLLVQQHLTVQDIVQTACNPKAVADVVAASAKHLWRELTGQHIS